MCCLFFVDHHAASPSVAAGGVFFGDGGNVGIPIEAFSTASSRSRLLLLASSTFNSSSGGVPSLSLLNTHHHVTPFQFVVRVG